jgi:4-hydroxy-3-methylbut-2-enyl diphosphate reductase
LFATGEFSVDVIRARVMGFCMGVRRAVEMAEAAAADAAASSRRDALVRTLGPLIHNPQVLALLRDRGVEVLGDPLPADLSDTTVIIRAHGVSPAAEEELCQRRAALIDATCPHVKKNQLKARALSEEGQVLFIAGEKQHGEVIGLQGYAPRSIVVANAVDAAQAARVLAAQVAAGAGHDGLPGVSAVLIAQTTISAEEYHAIGEAIRSSFPRLEIIDSICRATSERQESLRELCSQVDAVVVVGGRESSNTRRLADIARSLGKAAWLVESAADLRAGPLCAEIAGYRSVGLSAGASTPDTVIDEIEAALKSLPE